MRYKNLTIIGTSHISKDSVKEVEENILEIKPEIIAIELDPLRFRNLQKQKGKVKGLSPKMHLLNLIGSYIEKKLGKYTKSAPGSEMKKAIQLAKKHKIKISLIDQDIRITLKKLIKQITFKEKLRFIADLFKGIILRKSDINFDIRKVPSQKIINKILKKVKKRYPSVYNVLIKERNEIMAKNLKTLMHKYKDEQIIAVVGAGHEQAIINIIKKDV